MYIEEKFALNGFGKIKYDMYEEALTGGSTVAGSFQTLSQTFFRFGRLRQVCLERQGLVEFVVSCSHLDYLEGKEFQIF